jgi:hypothetical protein
MGTVRQRFGILAILLACAAAGAAGQTGTPAPLDKVPEDFPPDCPVIPNAIIRDYLPAVKNRVKVGNILVLETAATQDAILDFYKKALPANGWTVLKRPKSEADLLEGAKGDRRILLGVVATHQGANPSTTFRVVAVGKPVKPVK